MSCVKLLETLYVNIYFEELLWNFTFFVCIRFSLKTETDRYDNSTNVQSFKKSLLNFDSELKLFEIAMRKR